MRAAVARRPVLKSQASVMLIDKGNHRHFMAKEIYEQPEVVGHTLAHYLDMATERVALPMALPFDFRALKRISIAACGTAYYAGMVARYWFEQFARLPVEVDIASEFRYRDVPLDPGDALDLRFAIGRNRRHARVAALCARARAARAVRRQRADLDHRARKRHRDADLGRAGNRRRFDQGVHLPARGAGGARDRGRPRARRAVRERREATRARADRSAAASDRSARARAADRAARPRSGESARRALSRPRHVLPDRARRRAQAQGNLLHPRRGLRGRRAQARPDRARSTRPCRWS